jgi:hypothetical protein
MDTSHPVSVPRQGLREENVPLSRNPLWHDIPGPRPRPAFSPSILSGFSNASGQLVQPES